MVDLIPLYTSAFYEDTDIPAVHLSPPLQLIPSTGLDSHSAVLPPEESVTFFSSHSSSQRLPDPSLTPSALHSASRASLGHATPVPAQGNPIPGLSLDLNNRAEHQAVERNPRTRNGTAYDQWRRDSTSDTLDEESCTTIYIRYVAKDFWKTLFFPPGITVAQARDICMLRCNIWSPFTAANLSPVHGDASSDAENSDGEQSENGSGRPTSNHRPRRDLFGASTGGGTLRRNFADHRRSTFMAPGQALNINSTDASLAITNRQNPQAGQNMDKFRQQFGLFWTAAGHWLDPNRKLSSYSLSSSDVVELQHQKDFIYISPLHYHHHYAEGHMYKLYMDTLNPAWKLRWFVVRDMTLYCYRRREDVDALGTLRFRHPVRICEPSTNQLTRGSSTSSRNPSIGSRAEFLADSDISSQSAGVPSGSSGTGSGVLTLQVGDQQITLKTLNIMEHEHWRRIFQQMQADSVRFLKLQSQDTHRQSLCIDTTENTVNATKTSPLPNTLPAIDKLSLHPDNVDQDDDLDESDMISSRPGTIRSMKSTLSRRYSWLPEENGTSSHQPARESVDDDLMSLDHKGGWMMKKASIGYGFRRRYIVLKRGELWMFKDELAARASPALQRSKSHSEGIPVKQASTNHSAMSSFRPRIAGLSSIASVNSASQGSMISLKQVCVEVCHENARYYLRVTLVGESFTQLRKTQTRASMTQSSRRQFNDQRSDDIYQHGNASNHTGFIARGGGPPSTNMSSGLASPTSPTTPAWSSISSLSTVATGGFLRNIPDKRSLAKFYVESWEEAQSWQDAFLNIARVPVDDVIRHKLWIPRLDAPLNSTTDDNHPGSPVRSLGRSSRRASRSIPNSPYQIPAQYKPTAPFNLSPNSSTLTVSTQCSVTPTSQLDLSNGNGDSNSHRAVDTSQSELHRKLHKKRSYVFMSRQSRNF
ncbi:hypothetical protein IWQ62_000010 [Dispira parvispora]|uniref:PH domain-containing protein n=1 Tax=Dispira parvispora TaxID=1520584 RepID=A0A9W8B1J2_9FUNG|nr:hypothetical protein IWQ62_000010 [Dispira parvispora]